MKRGTKGEKRHRPQHLHRRVDELFAEGGEPRVTPKRRPGRPRIRHRAQRGRARPGEFLELTALLELDERGEQFSRRSKHAPGMLARCRAYHQAKAARRYTDAKRESTARAIGSARQNAAVRGPKRAGAGVSQSSRGSADPSRRFGRGARDVALAGSIRTRTIGPCCSPRLTLRFAGSSPVGDFRRRRCRTRCRDRDVRSIDLFSKKILANWRPEPCPFPVGTRGTEGSWFRRCDAQLSPRWRWGLVVNTFWNFWAPRGLLVIPSRPSRRPERGRIFFLENVDVGG